MATAEHTQHNRLMGFFDGPTSRNRMLVDGTDPLFFSEIDSVHLSARQDLSLLALLLEASTDRERKPSAPRAPTTVSKFVQGWQSAATKLKSWFHDPDQFLREDPDCEPPTKEAVMSAGRLATFLFEGGFAEPTQVAASPEGGVVFYRHEPPSTLLTFRVKPDGSLRHTVAQDGEVKSFRKLEIELSERPLWEQLDPA